MADSYLIHTHPFYELYYFLSGDVYFLHHGATYRMHPHTLILVAPNVFHGAKVVSDAPYERCTLHFAADSLSADRRAFLLKVLPDTLDRRPESCVFEHADRLGILPLLLDFDRLAEKSGPERPVLASLITEAILCRLLLHRPAAVSGMEDLLPPTDGAPVQPVLDYIHRHLTEHLTLGFLCEKFFVSKSRLNALFRAHTGVTCMDYVRTRRLNYARQLLLNGATSEQACQASGFGDYTSFYRAYRHLYGHSPSRDRQPSPVLHADDLLRVHEGQLHDPDDDQGSIWQRMPAVTLASAMPEGAPQAALSDERI